MEGKPREPHEDQWVPASFRQVLPKEDTGSVLEGPAVPDRAEGRSSGMALSVATFPNKRELSPEHG